MSKGVKNGKNHALSFAMIQGIKKGIARPIASELRSLMCPAWFDEFSLKVGDSLREKRHKRM